MSQNNSNRIQSNHSNSKTEIRSRRTLQRPPIRTFLTEEQRRQRWGPPPDDQQTKEEEANVVSSWTYSWMAEGLKAAAKADFPQEKNGIIQPVSLWDSSWTQGQRLQREFEAELKARSLWDGYIGQEVRLKSDSTSRGILCWVGCCQASASPRTLKVGIDWIKVPVKYQRQQRAFKAAQDTAAAAASAGHQPERASLLPDQTPEHEGPTAGETSSQATSKKPPQGPMHSGTLNGEVLFSTLDGKDTATVEAPCDVRFVHQLYDPVTRKPVTRGYPRTASLLRAAYRGWGGALMLAAVPRLIGDIATLCGPVVLEHFISYLSDPDSTWQQGTGWALAFILTYTIQSLANNRYMLISMRVGMQLRSCSVALIYDKAMRLSSKAQAIPEMSQGRIINMVSGDVERMIDVWTAHFVWSCPLQFIVAVALLYRLVGWCVFAGISVMFLSIPAQGLITRLQSRLRAELLKCTDNRIKATNELFSGIRIVKFMVWENKFIAQVDELRKTELAAFRKTQICRVASTFVSSSSPSLVMAGVFLAYHLSGHPLTPPVIFPTIALLNILRFPFDLVPYLMTIFVNMKVSMKRIAKFLEGDDLASVIKDPLFYDPSAAAGVEVEVETGGANTVPAANATEQVPQVVTTSKPVGESRGLKAPEGEEEDASTSKLPTQSQYAAAFSGASLTAFVPSIIDYCPSPGVVARMKASLSGCCGKGKSHQKKKEGGAKAATDEIHNLAPKTLLSNLSVRFPRGKLTIVAGPTGCGKTTLLSALLGEQELSQGSIYCESSVAYVPQQPWILNTTFKKNITFFEAGDEEWFQEVVTQCALGPDIEHLINGVDTEIGERGVTLSGGQKARVSLARAVYAKKSVYLLDDPLSAVDAHVSEKLMQSCFLEMLKDTTRILVTHHTQYIPLADYVVIMQEDGSVWFQGTPEQYNEQHGSDASTPRSGLGSRAQSMHTPMHSETAVGTPQVLAGANDLKAEDEDCEDIKDIILDECKDEKNENDSDATKGANKLMEDEEKATGHVTKDVYLTYIEACGGVSRLILLSCVYLLAEVANLGGSIWLTFWSTEAFGLGQSTYLYGYIGIVCAGAAGITIRAWFSFETMRMASLQLHKRLLVSVARAPMRFFDTTPLGRVLNRFAKDIDQVDNMLPAVWMGVGSVLFMMVGSLGLMVVTQWMIIIPLIPLAVIYFKIFKFFNAANRELKRVSSIAKSPIFALLSETLAGMRCIVAFHKTQEIMQEACRRLDGLFSVAFMQRNAYRWLGVRLELMATSVVFCMVFAAVVVKQTDFFHFDVGLMSLGVTLSLSLTSTLIWLVRTLAEVEAGMNSVERISHYATQLEQEETWKYTESSGEGPTTTSSSPPPPRGASINRHIDEATGEPLKLTVPQPKPCIDQSDSTLVFTNASLRYRPGLPLALNKLSFTIHPGEKVGVVGRTGSGKSTLMLALMRIVEVCEGSITLGGVSTRCFTLDDLRQRFAMIPQDPILFEGTIRSNLDPFEECDDDEELWSALRRVGMEHCIRQGPAIPEVRVPQTQKDGEAATGLDSVLSEGGTNFSVGQRQLLCLARAMLQKKAQFVLMDEATANIDPDLDAQIQKTVRTSFADKTVITIAHRLNTVLDADKIILLEKGGFLGEVGSPYDLVHKKTQESKVEGEQNGSAIHGKRVAKVVTGGLLRQMIAANGKSQERKLLALIDSAHKTRMEKKNA